MHRRLQVKDDGNPFLLIICLFCKPKTAAHSPHLPVLYTEVRKQIAKDLSLSNEIINETYGKTNTNKFANQGLFLFYPVPP